MKAFQIFWLLVGCLWMGVTFYPLGRWYWRDSGLPFGAVCYQDVQGQGGRPLVSSRYGLQGKPDYLVRIKGGMIVPVEVKSSLRPWSNRPYPSHLLQLAAYCLLAEVAMNCRVPYGVLKYRDGEIQVPYTPDLKQSLLAILAEMRTDEKAQRQHRDPRRCAACSYGRQCDQRL